jgi:hypothetical protein
MQFEIYHVIGDPTLEIWKELPQTVTVTAAVTARQLQIKLSSCPTGSVMTIWLGDDLLKRIEPTSTLITLPLPGRSAPAPGPQYAYLCFWAPGYRYVEIKARVS